MRSCFYFETCEYSVKPVSAFFFSVCEAAHTLAPLHSMNKTTLWGHVIHLGSQQKTLSPRGRRGLLKARGDAGMGAGCWPPHLRAGRRRPEGGLPGEVVPQRCLAAPCPWSLPWHLPVSTQSSPFCGQSCWSRLLPFRACNFSKHLECLQLNGRLLITGPRQVSPQIPPWSRSREPTVDPGVDPHCLYLYPRKCRNE